MTTKSILRIFVTGIVITLIGVQFFLIEKPNKLVGSIIAAIGIVTELTAVVMLFLPAKKGLNK